MNCVANGRLLREGPFDNIWVQPAAGDAGGALGSALLVWHHRLGKPRQVNPLDSQKGSFLGPSFNNADVGLFLDSVGANYENIDDERRNPQSCQPLDRRLELPRSGLHHVPLRRFGRVDFARCCPVFGDPRRHGDWKLKSEVVLPARPRSARARPARVPAAARSAPPPGWCARPGGRSRWRCRWRSPGPYCSAIPHPRRWR